MKPPTTQNPAYHIRLLFAIGRVARATHPYLTLEGAPSKLCLGGDFDVHPVTDLILVAEIPCLHAVGTETLPPDPPAGCYRRRPNFGTPESRSTFEAALERVRQQHELCVYGYVVMPEHVHLLVSEPERGTLAQAM